MFRKWIIVLLALLLIVAGCNTAPTSNEVTEVVKETEEDIIVDVEKEEVEEPTIEENDSKATLTESEEIETGESAPETETEDEQQTSETDTAEEEDSAIVDDNMPLLTNGTQVEELKAVWVSYLDLAAIFQLDSEEAYRQSMAELISNVKMLGMNTIMFQVRPFGDALYPSDLFPSSYIISGIEGEAFTYDPFSIVLELAHSEGLRVEAWINPYRIRTATSEVPLMTDGIAEQWLMDGSRRVLKASDGTIVYNPSHEEVQDRIVAGVEEIISHYAVDGIHFDDYFYPTTEATFDESEYLSFLHDNDAMTLEEWRRDNVNDLIAAVYGKVKAANRQITFGISPYGVIDLNYSELYADVALWVSEPGYVDYLIPQIYYGLNHEKYPYMETLQSWYDLGDGSVKIMPGLSVYKVGREDPWAGVGIMEWVESDGLLGSMIIEAKGQPLYSGYALFRYGSLFAPPVELEEKLLLEIENIKALNEF